MRATLYPDYRSTPRSWVSFFCLSTLPSHAFVTYVDDDDNDDDDPLSSPPLLSAPRSAITRNGHFAAFARPKRAITARSADPPESVSFSYLLRERRCYFLRIKILQIYEVMFSRASRCSRVVSFCFFFFQIPPFYISDVAVRKRRAL